MKKTLLTIVALSFAATFAMAGVVGSKHDFSWSSSPTGGTKTTTSQICVFCHAPHNTLAELPVPLWNHTMSSSTYTTYSGDNGASLGKNSLVCLSCHDGSVAITNLANNPTFENVDQEIAPAILSSAAVGTDGKMLSTAQQNMGTDLTNDHPVGIVYGSQSYHNQNYSFANSTGTTVYGTGWDTTKHKYGINNTTWQKDTTALNIGGLMSVSFFPNASNQPQVECATCHEPHNSPNLPNFLRVTNEKSRLCRDCHYTR